MTCPHCNGTYDTLICPQCADRRSRDMLLERQQVLAADIVSGRLKLTLTDRTVGAPVQHIVVSEGEYRRGLCWAEVHPPYMRKPYALIERERLCPKCLQVFEGLVELVGAER